MRQRLHFHQRQPEMPVRRVEISSLHITIAEGSHGGRKYETPLKNLQKIMNTLSKWYNVEVVFAREDLKNIRFTGDLPRYSNFDEILTKIGKTNEVNFRIENKIITISQ